jgi:hypothetical protein
MSNNPDSYGATRSKAVDSSNENPSPTPGATEIDDEPKAPIFDRVGDILGDTSRKHHMTYPSQLRSNNRHSGTIHNQ